MKRRSIVAGVVALVLVAAVVGAVAVPALFQAQKANNTTSTYYYSASVSTNATLTDASLLLPVPVGPDGDPTVENVQVWSDRGEVDWTTEVVDTERGPMLSIEADEIVGEGLYYLRNENGSLARPGTITRDAAPENMTGLTLEPALTRYELTAQVTVESFGNGIENGTIETRYPEGNSSMLSATYGGDDAACEPVWGGDDQTCSTFRADVYASYDADPSTLVRIGPIELWGINEWGWFFANSFNEFTQYVYDAEFVGSHDGWLSLPGELQRGKGNY